MFQTIQDPQGGRDSGGFSSPLLAGGFSWGLLGSTQNFFLFPSLVLS